MMYPTPDSVVDELYDQVTFGPGESPDWDVVRSLFLPQAVIVLRTSREATTEFDLEGWIRDFVDFIDRAKVDEKGFTERIVKRDTRTFGDMAHSMVLYEAQIAGSERPPQPGVDSMSLVKKDGRWWIAAITNEVPMEGHPLPEGFIREN